MCANSGPSWPLLVLLWLASCYYCSGIEIPDADWKRLESIFTTLKTDNASLSQLLSESQTQLTEAQKQLTLAREELTTLKQSLSETGSSLTKLKTSFDEQKNDRLWWAVGAGLIGLVVGILAP